ncbi:MAG: TPM domain-containing protein [Huintestinicola sp.]
MNIIKKISSVLLAAAAVLSFGINASAESEYKIYDHADLLSDEEEADLENQFRVIADEFDTDILVFTVESLDGGTVEDANISCYTSVNAGRTNGGISFLVCPGTREWNFYSKGAAHDDVFNANVREGVAASVREHLSAEDYYGAFLDFGVKCEEEMRYVSENGSNGTEGTGVYGESSTLSPVERAGAGIIVGAIIALISVLIMKSGMNTARPSERAGDYIRKDSFEVTRAQDIYLYTTVTRTKRPDNDSGMSSSDSGDSGSTSGSY